MMFIIPGNISSSGGYIKPQSLRINDNDSAYLTATFGGASDDNRKLTLDYWVKRNNLGTTQSLVQANDYYDRQSFRTTDQMEIVFSNGSSGSFKPKMVFRDPTTHMHIAYIYDSTQATNTDRFKMYVNGERIEPGNFDTETYPSQNATISFGGPYRHIIGANYNGGWKEYGDFIISDVRCSPGLALTIGDLGEFDDNGNWDTIEFLGVLLPVFLDISGVTKIGDMTQMAGLAAIGDGETSEITDNCAQRYACTESGVGVDWGDGNTRSPAQIICWGSSNAGFKTDGGNPEITITAKGSNSPYSLGGGTSLGSVTVTD
ncbi:MAG: hypothetical protein HN348_32945, partial [Proteobacteria bacterium]|nr:hypothetical protein [Pseudomonadota bacterium]